MIDTPSEPAAETESRTWSVTVTDPAGKHHVVKVDAADLDDEKAKDHVVGEAIKLLRRLFDA